MSIPSWQTYDEAFSGGESRDAYWVCPVDGSGFWDDSRVAPECPGCGEYMVMSTEAM